MLLEVRRRVRDIGLRRACGDVCTLLGGGVAGASRGAASHSFGQARERVEDTRPQDGDQGGGKQPAGAPSSLRYCDAVSQKMMKDADGQLGCFKWD